MILSFDQINFYLNICSTCTINNISYCDRTRFKSEIQWPGKTSQVKWMTRHKCDARIENGPLVPAVVHSRPIWLIFNLDSRSSPFSPPPHKYYYHQQPKINNCFIFVTKINNCYQRLWIVVFSFWDNYIIFLKSLRNFHKTYYSLLNYTPK
jgi:hypothetical protein